MRKYSTILSFCLSSFKFLAGPLGLPPIMPSLRLASKASLVRLEVATAKVDKIKLFTLYCPKANYKKRNDDTG